MAQFAAIGRIKLLFTGDGVECRDRDPFHYKLVGGLRSNQVHRRKFRFVGSKTAKIYSSWNRKKWSQQASLHGSDKSVFDESDDEDYDSDMETDDLACFRGLVLDISYRFVLILCFVLIVVCSNCMILGYGGFVYVLYDFIAFRI